MYGLDIDILKSLQLEGLIEKQKSEEKVAKSKIVDTEMCNYGDVD